MLSFGQLGEALGVTWFDATGNVVVRIRLLFDCLLVCPFGYFLLCFNVYVWLCLCVCLCYVCLSACLLVCVLACLLVCLRVVCVYVCQFACLVVSLFSDRVAPTSRSRVPRLPVTKIEAVVYASIAFFVSLFSSYILCLIVSSVGWLVG